MKWYHNSGKCLQDGEHRELFASDLLFETIGGHVFQPGFHLYVIDQLAESCHVLYSWSVRSS